MATSQGCCGGARSRYPSTSYLPVFLGFPGGSVVKTLPANAGDIRHAGLIPGSGRAPRGEHGKSLQYSCLETPHGQRSWVGYSPRGRKAADSTE